MKQVVTSGRDPAKKYIPPTDIPEWWRSEVLLRRRKPCKKKSLVAAARRGEITSKSPENLSEHFLNSAFARLAYYFYGSPTGETRREGDREKEREQGSCVRGNAARSISNMLINDPFER